MHRAPLLLCCLVGCGYLGYDEPDDDTPIDGGVDATDAMCTLGAPDDFCVSLPRLPDAPVLDGVVDCGLSLSTFGPVGWYSTGDAPVPEGFVTRYAAAWRPDGLYVYVEIDDTNLHPADIVPALLYCGDAAEIYVDADGVFDAPPAYDTAGTRQFLARAPDQGDARETTGEVFRQQTRIEAWRSAGFSTWTRPGGYALEAFIEAEDLGLATWSLSAGDRIGFDLGVNVSTIDGSPSDCDVRLGQYFLRDVVSLADPCVGRPYCDVGGFCTPTLSP